MLSSPSGNVEQAISTLDGNINDLTHGNTPDVLLLGDTNIDLHTNNTHTKRYTQFLRENLLNQMITSPTRITNTKHLLLDHIITNNTDYYNLSETIDSGLSDHLLVYTTRK